MSTEATTQMGNGMAVTALVCGIVGAVFGLIPILGLIAFPLGVLALIFGVVGRRAAKRGAPRRGMATAGVVLGPIAVVLAVIGLVIVNSAVNELDEDLEQIETELQQDQEQIDRELRDAEAEFQRQMDELENGTG